MFIEATNHSQNLANQIHEELYEKLEHLDKTASSWYDESSRSVQGRQSLLRSTATLARRVASFSDEDDAADLHGLADSLSAQAHTLSSMVEYTNAEEYSGAFGDAPRFSSKDLTDESRTASVRQTDWDLYLAVEPRQFVASNRSARSAEEMRERGFNFISEEVAGHGLSRKAKIELTESFLARVEHERKSLPKTAKKAAQEVVFEDSALFI